MSTLNTYKQTLKSFLNCSSNTKLLVTTQIGFDLVKNVFSQKNLLDFKIVGTCLVNDIISHDKMGDHEMVFFVDHSCINIIIDALTKYPNKKYIYFYAPLNHHTISQILHCNISHTVLDIAQCTMNILPISDYCTVGTISTIFSVMKSVPICVVSQSDRLRETINDTIAKSVETFTLFRAKDETKLVLGLERSYDELVDKLFSWKYESMLHAYGVKLDGSGFDDYIFGQIKYKTYDEAVRIVKAETEKIKPPNKDNVLDVLEYEKKNKICARHVQALASLEQHLTKHNVFGSSEMEQRAIIRDVDKTHFASSKDGLSDLIYSLPKQSFKSDCPIFSQFTPTIRLIMENATSKKKLFSSYKIGDDIQQIYIYVGDFVTYEEVAEVELFNRSSTIKFYLISDRIINFWSYITYSSNEQLRSDDHLRINKSIHTVPRSSRKIESQIELNIKKLNDYHKMVFHDDPDISKKIIDETIVLIANEYAKLKAYSPTNPIEENDKRIKMIELNRLSTQFKQTRDRHDRTYVPTSAIASLFEEEKNLISNDTLSLTMQSADEHLLDERDKQIGEFVTSIRTLNQTFIDLKLLVESQGLIIDQIDTHILKTADFVEHGVFELQKASNESKIGKKLMTTIATALGTVAMAFGIGFGIKAAI